MKKYNLIIQYIPPPELHILIGIVTHLFIKLENEYPEIADQWLSNSKLKFFKGQKQFNGNTARQLLKNYNYLEKLAPGL